MKRSYFVLIILLVLINSSVYAGDKTQLGAQLSTLDFSIFIDAPTSHKSSFRLEAGFVPYTESAALGIKYRSLFGGSESRYYWEVGALYLGPGEFLGLNVSEGTSALISLGVRSSKRASGRWFANLMFISGPGGQGIGPRFGYEFAQ
jgi:hypothetical protein